MDTVYGGHQFFTQLRGETTSFCITSSSYPAQQQSPKDSPSEVLGNILLLQKENQTSYTDVIKCPQSISNRCKTWLTVLSWNPVEFTELPSYRHLPTDMTLFSNSIDKELLIPLDQYLHVKYLYQFNFLVKILFLKSIALNTLHTAMYSPSFILCTICIKPKITWPKQNLFQ